MIERHEQFDDFLNDAYGVTRIMGMPFYPSDILYECDPIAYRVFAHDFLSEKEEEEGGDA